MPWKIPPNICIFQLVYEAKSAKYNIINRFVQTCKIHKRPKNFPCLYIWVEHEMALPCRLGKTAHTWVHSYMQQELFYLKKKIDKHPNCFHEVDTSTLSAHICHKGA